MRRWVYWIAPLVVIATAVWYVWTVLAHPPETMANLWPLPGAVKVHPVGVSRDSEGNFRITGTWEWQLEDQWIPTSAMRDVIVFGLQDGNENPVELKFLDGYQQRVYNNFIKRV